MKIKLARVNIIIKIGKKTVSMIRFADDMVIGKSEGDIQRAVDEILRNENK